MSTGNYDYERGGCRHSQTSEVNSPQYLTDFPKTDVQKYGTLSRGSSLRHIARPAPLPADIDSSSTTLPANSYTWPGQLLYHGYSIYVIWKTNEFDIVCELATNSLMTKILKTQTILFYRLAHVDSELL